MNTSPSRRVSCCALGYKCRRRACALEYEELVRSQSDFCHDTCIDIIRKLFSVLSRLPFRFLDSETVPSFDCIALRGSSVIGANVIFVFAIEFAHAARHELSKHSNAEKLIGAKVDDHE